MVNNKFIVVSMTSWKKRLINVVPVVMSILENKVKPDIVVLNLSTDEFPRMEKELPQGILTLAKMSKRFKINWVKENTTVFKKFIPVIKSLYGKSYYLFTIDDDEIYDRDYIATGVKHLEKGNRVVVIARRNVSLCEGVWGGLTCYDGSVFKPDYWECITPKLLSLRMNDPYTNGYLKHYGVPIYSVCEKHNTKFNDICPNRGLRKTYSAEQITAVENEVKNIESKWGQR
jgi:hypothetical protein